MHKKLFTLLLAVLLLLPMLPATTTTAADIPMPNIENFATTSLYDDTNDYYVTEVLNNNGEVWLYYIGRAYNDTLKKTVYNKQFSKSLRLTDNAQAIVSVSRGLFVLGNDGYLRYWEIRNDKITPKGIIKGNITDIANCGYYSILALDNQGNVYSVDTDFLATSQSGIDVNLLDSGVSLIAPVYYLKGTDLMTITNEEPGYKLSMSNLPNNIVSLYSNSSISIGTKFILTADGELWGWGSNATGQLACGEYNQTGPYWYVGSYDASRSILFISQSTPIKVNDGVKELWPGNKQIIAKMKDGTYTTWGDGEPIMAWVDATDGYLHISDKTYPDGWPNCKGWTIRKTTVTEWTESLDYKDIVFKADGTMWMDLNDTDSVSGYSYVGIWNDNTPKPIYSDVAVGSYCDEPVRWAVKENITTGATAKTFEPNTTCTQAQILTFLWRADGSPEPAIKNPYKNSAISSDQYFYKALLWAWEEHLIADPNLNPNANCLRSDVVTYLWTLDGQPTTNAANFTDVAASADYAAAVNWAVSTGITTGTTATTFEPTATCTRGQIVTFLYRFYIDF